ncbi:MAG: NAD(P)/FAD-dependent oxidoreductase, partial [Pyrinomonadaceae bacterium]
GQLFCRDSAKQIVQMLLDECSNAKVEILTNCSVENVKPIPVSTSARDVNAENLTDGRAGRTPDSRQNVGATFEIETTRGKFTCENLVIATGGLSFPKIGATDFGYRIARRFGLKIVQTNPSLVALAFSKNLQNYKNLAGVSLDSIVSCGKHSFRENILFTHRGLSGPAILQISNYRQKNKSVSIDLMPEKNAAELLRQNHETRQRLDNFLSGFLPNRFAEIFTERNFPNKPIYQLNKKEIEDIAETINNWQATFDETEGYDKAEVTLGGVDTSELSSQTLEAKKIKGLYFIGEVVDVTGWLGGYNFQWAWSSGFAAGQAI